MASFRKHWPFEKQQSTDSKVAIRDSEQQDGEPGDEATGDIYQTSSDRKTIGFTSAVFLILNRMIGTGIFATPSAIFSLSGSVGLALFMWVAGTIIAAAGMLVYMEFGTGIPRNGGEKNYIEFVYRKPRFLATGFYTGYVVLLGWAGSNSVVFGEYILTAAKVEVNRFNQRGVGLACLTAAFLIHGLALKWGLRLQNLLGTIKIIILLIIIIAGFVALGGHINIEPKPDNFKNAFSGTTGSAYGVVTALYNVIWSFIGYSNANYALSETKDPVKTLKRAAPTAIILVAILYMLANIAYFAAVPRAEILSSGRILAASFFRNVMGSGAERALSVFVALSAFGNVLSVIFSQGRLVQELGREGILPFSRFWASNKPFNAPLAGLFEHWVVAAVIMLAPPPGDAYNLILNTISYPLAVVNAFVAFGLVWLYFHRDEYNWHPPFSASLPVAIFFLLSNIYLVVAPFVPPDTPDQNVYNSLPYFLHCVIGLGILAAGGVYWLIWAQLLPRLGGYRLEKKTVVGSDGWSRNVFVHEKGLGGTTRHPDSSSNAPSASQDVFDARGILKERLRGRRKEYLIDWEGVDPQTGKAYPPSWEPEQNVGSWHIRQWNLSKKAKRKRSGGSTASSPSRQPDSSGSFDASLESVAAPRHRKRRRLVIQDSSAESDLDSVSLAAHHGQPRTPTLDSDAASTQPASGLDSPAPEIAESQEVLSDSSPPFIIDIPANRINPEDFESYHSSQPSFPSIQPPSQATDLVSSGKLSDGLGLLTAAHQRVIGSGTSSSISPQSQLRQLRRLNRTTDPVEFGAEEAPSATQPSLLSQQISLSSSPPGRRESSAQHTSLRNPSQDEALLSSAQQPLQPSQPLSSTYWRFQTELFDPITDSQDPSAAVDMTGVSQSPGLRGSTPISNTQVSNQSQTGVFRSATDSHTQQSAPVPSIAVADSSSASNNGLAAFPSAQASIPESHSLVESSVAAPIDDSGSGGSALPIQESIEEEPPSSSAEDASLASKASSSQASLENERLVPQIEGISLPLQPVLGPAEYTIALPAEGKIQSAYADIIKAKRKSITRFIHRRDSVGSATGSTSRTRERNEMIELIDRLHDTTTHFDLGLPGFSTQFSLRSEEHAAFAQYAGSKFVFLSCLVDALSTVDCTVIIAAKTGPVQQLIEEFLVMKRIHVTRHDRPHSARSKTPDFHQTTLKIDLLDTSADTEVNLSSRPVLLVAFDASFDNQNPQIKQIRELNSRGRNQLLPVVHLLTSNSSEHVDRCLRKSMPSPQRLKLLVRGTYQAKNNLGGSPTYVPDPSDRPEGRPMDMNDLQRAVRKSPNRKLNMVAHIVARAAITEDFEQYWTLGAMPEVQYDELDDVRPELSERSTGVTGTGTVTPRNEHDRSRTPTSGKKHLLDPDDIKLQAILSKRQRMSPYKDSTPTPETARDGTAVLDLREQIKALQAELSAERQMRAKVEADLEREKSRSVEWEKAHNTLMQRYDTRRLKQHKLDNENKRLQGLVESTREKNEKLTATNTSLKEQVSTLKAELSTSREELRASVVPELAALEAARSEAREAAAKVASLEKQLHNKNQDFDFTRQQYQQASNRAAELGQQNSEFEAEIAQLQSLASDEKRKLRELNISETTKQDLERIDNLEQENKVLERLVKKMRDELEAVKKTRGVQTRGSSVQPPGSPAGVGTRSRQASPAAGVVDSRTERVRESYGNVNHRVSGLRNES
ncbi:hypothetical protein DV738_g2265, partial [Chaetothyriales sp. CBS 135597]